MASKCGVWVRQRPQISPRGVGNAHTGQRCAGRRGRSPAQAGQRRSRLLVVHSRQSCDNTMGDLMDDKGEGGKGAGEIKIKNAKTTRKYRDYRMIRIVALAHIALEMMLWILQCHRPSLMKLGILADAYLRSVGQCWFWVVPENYRMRVFYRIYRRHGKACSKIHLSTSLLIFMVFLARRPSCGHWRDALH